MGYATGAATSVSDLLSAIESFAVAEGWTVDSSKANRSDNATYGECLNISKGDVRGAFFSVLSVAAGLNIVVEFPYGYGLGTYSYPAYSGANGNMAQANPSTRTITNNLGTSGYVAHHLFGGPNHIHVVIEVTSGLFKHVGLGQINKFGAVTTGVYNYGVRWDNASDSISSITNVDHSIAFDCYSGAGRFGASTILRADSDAVSPRYFDAYAHETTNKLACGWRWPFGGVLGTLRLPFNMGVSSLTGRAILLPLMMSVQRTGGLYSPVGLIPDVRAVRMTNINPGAVLTISSDNCKRPTRPPTPAGC